MPHKSPHHKHNNVQVKSYPANIRTSNRCDISRAHDWQRFLTHSKYEKGIKQVYTSETENAQIQNRMLRPQRIAMNASTPDVRCVSFVATASGDDYNPIDITATTIPTCVIAWDQSKNKTGMQRTTAPKSVVDKQAEQHPTLSCTASTTIMSARRGGGATVGNGKAKHNVLEGERFVQHLGNKHCVKCFSV
jgi:hypothetical protein